MVLNKKNIKILIIDDNSKNLQVAMNILSQEGYSLLYAQDGLKGLELVNKYDISLILLDILMPGMDGYEVCKILKQQPDSKDIPIIFLTVKDDEKDIVKGFDYGGVDYITKPFHTSVLLKRVETHLRLVQTTNELKRINKDLEKEIDLQVQKIRLKDQILFQQSRMASMGEMIANIAHQWRQPLAAISSAVVNIKIKLKLNKFDFNTKEGQGECLNYLDKKFEDIDEYIDNLSQTIDDFRNFFKPQKQKEKFNLEDVIKRSIKLLKANMNNVDITVINNVKSLEMNGFSSELAQVVINLLNNARDAMLKSDNSDKKFIVISSKVEDEYLYLDIQDCGNGVKEDIIDKIFEPYFTTKQSSHGTGIGLYMIKEIVHKHMNGTVSVKNQFFTHESDEYYGAKFTVKIPINL